MKETLILYEGKYGHSKKTAELLQGMLENSLCCPAAQAPESLLGVKNLILVVGFLAYDTARLLKPYLRAHQPELAARKVYFVGVGLAKQALPAFQKLVEEPMGRTADGSWFVMGGYRAADLDPEDRRLLEEFWGKKGQAVTDKLYFRETEVQAAGKELMSLIGRA